MKRNVLALSIAAMVGGLGLVGTASATLTVTTGGTGNMLLVPYFTSQNGNMTVLHVVNTDATNGKAVKVRFRGASNSDDVLDFQVFMSPGDVWTAAVTADPVTGLSQLTTADNTCTLPSLAGAAQKFVTNRLNPALTGDALASQTREGYVEIFNMADIDGASTYVVNAVPGQHSALYTAIKHVGGVPPCTASVLNGTLATGPTTTGLMPPTTGLTGSWYIINVPQTTTYSGSMTAITSAGVATNNVFSAQSTGAAALTTADPLFNGQVLTLQNYDVPDLSTPYDATYATAAAQASALATQLSAQTVMNQYATDPSISAKTDWVFSMPTRRYNIAVNYAAPVSQLYATVAGTTPTYVGTATAATAYRYINNDMAGAFFTTATNSSVNAAGQVCAKASSTAFYDREETTQVSGAVFSPGQVSVPTLCGEVSVMSFGSGSVLGATVATSTASTSYVNGWGSVSFAAPGVPMLGSSFMMLTNPNVGNGKSGTYGITWPHVTK